MSAQWTARGSSEWCAERSCSGSQLGHRSHCLANPNKAASVSGSVVSSVVLDSLSDRVSYEGVLGTVLEPL